MNFIILSCKDKPFDKVAIRKDSVFKVTAICDTVTVFLYNGEQIEVAESLSEVIKRLNKKTKRILVDVCQLIGYNNNAQILSFFGNG